MSGTVYKQAKSPYWWIKYYLDGKPHYESTKTTNKKQANQILADRIATQRSPDKRNISALLDELKADYEINGKSLKWCEIVVEKHLRPYFGKLKVENLHLSNITAYINKRKDKEIANSTINKELALLRRSFSLADLKFPKITKLTENNTRTTFLTEEQYHALVRCAPEHLKPVIVFAYQTGMRRGEILSLKWSQVDWKQREITLPPLTTKNKQGRTIPLTSALYRILESLFNAKESCPYVFTYRGQQLKSIKMGFPVLVKTQSWRM